MSNIDWSTWHEAYDRPGSYLAARLAVVQQRIRESLDQAPPGPLRAISMCAGAGRDLLGVLESHPRAHDVSALLVERDERNVAAAREAAGRARLGSVSVVCGDAASSDAYASAVPADLILVCGVFGNIGDADIGRTIAALPSLCAPRATVVWTRHRRPPDRTLEIRRCYEREGFEEIAFDAPDRFLFSVGVHRLRRPPRSFEPGLRLFEFVGYDALLARGAP